MSGRPCATTPLADREARAAGITAPLQIMQSNGGTMCSTARARSRPTSVESGPAAGVIASARLARATRSAERRSRFDMGGTTAKAAMIENGEPARTTRVRGRLRHQPVEQAREGRRLSDQAAVHRRVGDRRRRRLDRRRSTSSADASVGPRSAGAVPGPVCYGAGGTEPTFTDAPRRARLSQPGAARRRAREARRRRRPRDALRRAHRRAARPAARSRPRYGIYTIAAATMTRAVKAVTTYRGRDPRDFVL